MRLAIVKDGVVVNVTKVADDWTGVEGEWQPPDGAMVVPSDEAAPGWLHDGEFHPPASAEALSVPLPRLVVPDRLTDGEVAIVAALQSGNVQQQRWWLRWVSADTVNPGNPEVVAGFGAVFSAERAAELLAPED